MFLLLFFGFIVIAVAFVIVSWFTKDDLLEADWLGTGTGFVVGWIARGCLPLLWGTCTVEALLFSTCLVANKLYGKIFLIT